MREQSSYNEGERQQATKSKSNGVCSVRVDLPSSDFTKSSPPSEENIISAVRDIYFGNSCCDDTSLGQFYQLIYKHFNMRFLLGKETKDHIKNMLIHFVSEGLTSSILDSKAMSSSKSNEINRDDSTRSTRGPSKTPEYEREDSVENGGSSVTTGGASKSTGEAPKASEKK